MPPAQPTLLPVRAITTVRTKLPGRITTIASRKALAHMQELATPATAVARSGTAAIFRQDQGESATQERRARPSLSASSRSNRTNTWRDLHSLVPPPTQSQFGPFPGDR